MKKIYVFSMILFSVISEIGYSQNTIEMSGGNNVSSLVCVNRQVYVWGNNKTTIGNGLLGCDGCIADYYTTPQLVSFPLGVQIQQVNSGSGSHFLAIDTDGNPWAWGNNSMGQVGDGNQLGNGGFNTSPSRIMALPEIDIANKDGLGNLTNVVSVTAGANVSYAILQNSNLVSWGQNGKGFDATGSDDGYGLLGNGVLSAVGVTSNQTAAGYVKMSDGSILTGVTQVYSGDNFAMALVDIDGDGIGTLYTWGDGKSGTLARNLNGTVNPATGAEVKDAWARPALYADGSIMNNIVQIQAGDVFGAALDDNGYIWTWGNGGWNNATGSTIVNYTGSDPRKVLKGFTVGNSNDGTYLLAKQVAAGQGYGMAITIDNKPVAWGGGGVTDGGGFNIGSNSGTEYISYETDMVHSDVINIFRGDTYGFYKRTDNSIWAWGNNIFGQLGLGISSDEVFMATNMSLPINCLEEPQILDEIKNVETNGISILQQSKVLRVIAESEISSIQIYSVTGTIVSSLLDGNNTQIDVSLKSLSKGVYIVVVRSNGEIHKKSIMIL